MDRAHELELRITQGRLRRRLTIAGAAVAAGFAVLAVVLAVAGLPWSRLSITVAAGVAIGTVLGAYAMRGPDPAFTSEGIRLRAFPLDLAQVLVPWRDVERTWIGALGRYTCLFILPKDPQRLRHGVLRGLSMARSARRHGTELQIYLPPEGLSHERIRAGVEQFSDGAVRVGPAPEVPV